MRGVAIAVLVAWVVACRSAETPRDDCRPMPRSARGCLDGNLMRPPGCTLPHGPTGPDSPGTNCTCVMHEATSLVDWDCKGWLQRE